MRNLGPTGGWLGALVLGALVGATGCVGPTTPLGAIDTLVPAVAETGVHPTSEKQAATDNRGGPLRRGAVPYG